MPGRWSDGPGENELKSRIAAPAVIDDGSLKSVHDWDAVGVMVREGASIGARAVRTPPVTLGRRATIAVGSVVTQDVPDFANVEGWRCPTTREVFTETD